MKELLKKLGIDYLLVCSTNRFLVEYPELSENARYTLTGFTGSTGDALITNDGIFLFVDGRYHEQADREVKDGVTVLKLQIGQKQDEEIRKIIEPDKTLGIVSKKISQSRLESYNGYKIKLLDCDPINNYTENRNLSYEIAFKPKNFSDSNGVYISNLEEVSYLTGLRNFSKDNSSKVWSKLFINGEERVLFNTEEETAKFLSSYKEELVIDKKSINAYEFSLIKKPIHKTSEVSKLKSIKTVEEIEAYKKAFERTDIAVSAIRHYIENNDNLTEYDISIKLKEEFKRSGAKCLSFNPIVAINRNSALAHYSKSSKDVMLHEGDLVLIDCGAYYGSGLATDITRVFVKGEPNKLQKEVYTQVLKTFLNCYKFDFSSETTGHQIDSLAHKMLDSSIEGFVFNHGLGHGIGINVHEAPPNLSQNEIAKTIIENNMCFTIEPGLYNPKCFGVRLENSCYKQNNKIRSFVNMGFEGKLIDYTKLTDTEKIWLEEFAVL